jgi:tetratricopeptide (TPR) repeat protein
VTLEAAEALLDVGRAEQARQLVAGILVVEPSSAEALCLLARCHRLLDDHRSMLASAEAAAAAAPDLVEPHLLRADALLQLDRAAEALAAADTALAIAPDLANTHLVRALALFNTGDRRDGWAELREATRLAPHWPTAHFVTGSMHHSVGNVNKARQAYRRTLRLRPDHPGALEGLGHLALTAGRLGAAVRSFGAAGAADPDTPAAAAGVDRALRGLAGWGLLTGWLLGFVLIFGQLWLAWPVGGGLVILYALWFTVFWRRTPRQLRGTLRHRLRADPRVRVRLVLAAVTAAGAVAIGAYTVLDPVDEHSPRPARFLLGLLGWLLVSAAIAITVDVRHARRRRRVAAESDQDSILAELAPEERGALDGGRLVLRWVRAAAVATVVPWTLAVQPSPLHIRASIGTVCLGLLVLYCAWSVHRWRRHPGPPLSPVLLPFAAPTYLVLGAIWVGLLAAAYWPAAAPPSLLMAVLFVAIGVTLMTQIFWLPFALARRTWRALRS